jgi:hypothetical protein
MDIRSYVSIHTVRGECICGLCADRGDRPDPVGHTINNGFFKVALVPDPKTGQPPSAGEFKSLTEKWKGDFAECDPLDGNEHSYLELGAWIGDQGLALQFMSLGTLLGVFKLLTPALLGLKEDDPLFQRMAGQGFITAKAT